MADQPIAISDITDPSQIRVRLLASGQDVHAPLGSVAAASIHGAPTKATPVDADEFGYWDSVALKAVKTTWANIKATIWTSLGALINGGTGKTTPVDADMFAIADSAASNATKKLTWANLKATLRIGTATNDNAAAGNIGQYTESVIVSGSAVSLVTSTAKTITSISLTAGDWDVDGVVSFLPANTTSVTAFVGCYSLTTNTLDVTPGRVVAPPTTTKVYDGGTAVHAPTPNYRFSLASTTTIFLIGYSTFTVSTNVAYGMIRARRMR